MARLPQCLRSLPFGVVIGQHESLAQRGDDLEIESDDLADRGDHLFGPPGPEDRIESGPDPKAKRSSDSNGPRVRNALDDDVGDQRAEVVALLARSLHADTGEAPDRQEPLGSVADGGLLDLRTRRDANLDSPLRGNDAPRERRRAQPHVLGVDPSVGFRHPIAKCLANRPAGNTVDEPDVGELGGPCGRRRERRGERDAGSRIRTRVDAGEREAGRGERNLPCLHRDATGLVARHGLAGVRQPIALTRLDVRSRRLRGVRSWVGGACHVC